MTRLPLLIDTDPGVDDALALLMAMAHPGFELVGLTIAAGNVGLSHTVANALKLCEVAGADVPVFPGCAVPLVYGAADASYVHGRDGFGDTGYLPATRSADAEHAALAILRLSHVHAGRLVLVMLGPLTNLALALRLDPTLPSRIGRLVVMGGAINGRGNTSVPAEFNIGFDPEAAHIVFEAMPTLELCDWEGTLAHTLDLADLDGWLARGDARAAFYAAISANTRARARELHDGAFPCADAFAMAAVLEPEGVQEQVQHAVAIETGGRLARGATVVDWLDRSDAAGRATLVLRYDQARFEALVRQALGCTTAG